MAVFHALLSGGSRASVVTALLAAGIVGLLTACGGAKDGDKTKQAAAAAPVPTVVVMDVVQKTVPIYAEYVGQTDARETVEIRARVQAFLEAMAESGALPEFECFDTGIVRTVEMYARTGLYRGHLDYNFVMGVESGMPADPELLPILMRLIAPGATWQVTAIGRASIWPLHRRTAELGGNLRTGLEDTFYLPDGSKATSNGPLIEAIVRLAREAGCEIASPAEARSILHIQ